MNLYTNLKINTINLFILIGDLVFELLNKELCNLYEANSRARWALYHHFQTKFMWVESVFAWTRFLISPWLFSGLAQEAQAHYENYELSYFSIIERNVTSIFSF